MKPKLTKLAIERAEARLAEKIAVSMRGWDALVPAPAVLPTAGELFRIALVDPQWPKNVLRKLEGGDNDYRSSLDIDVRDLTRTSPQAKKVYEEKEKRIQHHADLRQKFRENLERKAANIVDQAVLGEILPQGLFEQIEAFR